MIWRTKNHLPTYYVYRASLTHIQTHNVSFKSITEKFMLLQEGSERSCNVNTGRKSGDPAWRFFIRKLKFRS